MKQLKIRDLTLRDGQQSQFATRMTQAQVDRVLPYYSQAGFYACEVWGGALPDAIMRFLDENPWHRLEKIKASLKNTTKLTALSRGRNLFGYRPYPDEVIEGFFRNALSSGLDIVRIFDALNDFNNIKSSIKLVKSMGGTADCAVCFTVDPAFSFGEKVGAFFKGKKLPSNLFGIKYFVAKAKELESLGADIITIKDMAGLVSPAIAADLVKALKKEVKIPINLHTHCTPGYGLASILTAIINGVDIVDTVIMNFAGGPAAPAFELVQIFADKLGIDTGVNKKAIAQINLELKAIREELSRFDTFKLFPLAFAEKDYTPPAEADTLFDRAIELAKSGKYDELVTTCHQIEKFYNFPAPDENVKKAEIPGGMYTNMLEQLRQLKIEHLFDRVLQLVPKVRLDSGCPPLVTPTSQIVGSQAVNLALDESKDKPHYTSKTSEFINLVKGEYGKTPFPVDPDFREQIAGVREETNKMAPYEKQVNPLLPEYGNVKMAQNEKEELLLELLPSVATGFLKKRREEEFRATKTQEELLERDREDAARKERAKTFKTVITDSMIEELYNNNW